MRLASLRIRQFRAYRDVTVDLGPGTVLVGANNVGKSAVIAAIRFLLGLPDVDGRVFTEESTSYGPWDGYGSGRPVIVEGTFVDMSPATETALSGLLVEGRLRVVSILYPQGGPANTLVLTHLVVKSLREINDVEGLIGGDPYDRGVRPQSAEDLGFRPPSWTVGDVVWLPPKSALQYRVPVLRDLLPTVISIPGPDQPLPGLGDLVRPLADPIIAAWTSSIERTLPNEFTQLSDQLDSRLGVPLSEAVRRALGARGASWEIGEGLGYRPALREAIDEFVEVVIGHRQLQVAFDDLDGAAFDGTQPLQTLGAGARRQALLAALALYAAESNVGVGPIIATVEEPEVGLHAAAQRNTAEDLARLPRFGVQVVLTTHSPSVLSRLPRDWYRLVRSVSTIHAGTETGIQRRTEIVPSADLDAITEELGLSPADALLGSTYVVVEGRSDELILTAWAATLGLDLPTAGVRFAPARGHGWAEHSLRLQEIVHPSARIEFLLDEGPETRATARSLRRSSGDRVQVKFLPTTEIEGLFSRRAVGAWLGEAATATVPDPPTKAWLRRTSRASLHRDYAVVQDGVDIASRMLEAEIHPDIVDFLSGLAGQTQ